MINTQVLTLLVFVHKHFLTLKHSEEITQKKLKSIILVFMYA